MPAGWRLMTAVKFLRELPTARRISFPYLLMGGICNRLSGVNPSLHDTFHNRDTAAVNILISFERRGSGDQAVQSITMVVLNDGLSDPAAVNPQ